MMDSFFEYKHQIIQTGDIVKCTYRGEKINDARVYVCSSVERITVSGVGSHFIQIIFICNNIKSNWNPGTHTWNPDFLGYTYALGTGLLDYGYFNPDPLANDPQHLCNWSDGVSNFEKVEKDKLKELIDLMILKDKLAIKGVYKNV